MYQLASLHGEFRSYAQKLTNNKVMAEDLVQEALKRFLDNEDSAIQNREGYIKRTIHNLYVTGLRKQKRHRVYVMLSANSDSYTFFSIVQF